MSEAVGGGLLVSPGTVNFGDVLVGHEADSSVNVTNSSSSSMVISQVNVSGQTFSVLGNNSMPISIPAGGTYTLKVGFKPASITSYSGQLSLMDKSAQMIAQVPMQGQGASQGAPQLTVSSSSLSFGSVPVNTSTTQSLTLTSTGTSPVTVNSGAITGTGFTIVGGSLPVTLNPAQTLTLQVQFLPTAAGAASGQIAINSNSSTGATAVVALSGTGTTTANPQTNPQLTVSASSLSFGSVTVNTATTQSLTLTSTGTSPVTVSSAAITGTGFTIVGGILPVTLNPTQAVTLQVQFNPTSTGAASGQITISSNSLTGANCSGGPERYEHGSTESSVDNKRREFELRQCDGEHGNDAVFDVDVDWDVTGDSELCCDCGRWLYDHRGEFACNANSYPVDDTSSAVPADIDWNN